MRGNDPALDIVRKPHGSAVLMHHSMVSSWEEARRFVEPVVRDIDQPHRELLRAEVVLYGDGQEQVGFEFAYEAPTAERNAALIRRAAALLLESAASIERTEQGFPDSGGS